MFLAFLAIVIGLVVLLWSAERFVDGAAATAKAFALPPLLIGMLVVGFGTSAPEIVVSVFSALQGNSGLALGNAYGSNITNIALILGMTALLSPIAVRPQIVRSELPPLLAATALTVGLLWDGQLTRLDGLVLLITLAAFLFWTLRQTSQEGSDGEEVDNVDGPPVSKSLFWVVAGLLLLVVSSRALVWGAVTVAQSFGVSDLLIGLTIVAVGTSLPELASSITAVRRNEHDLALGNVLGSNMFNTLAVAGIAATIHPAVNPPEIMQRDIPVMVGLTLLLAVMCFSFRQSPAHIDRIQGGLLLLIYVAYTLYLVSTVLGWPSS